MPSAGGPKSSGHRITVAEKQRQALILRRGGATFEQIAERLGYASRKGAHKAVSTALRRLVQEPAEELRALELDRLDALHRAVWPAAMAGDVKAVDRALKIMARRVRLLGLDLPLKVDVRAIVDEIADEYGLTDEERDELFADMKRELARARGQVRNSATLDEDDDL